MTKSEMEYWNDIESEKQKAYWIEDESDLKMLKFIREQTNLERCFADSLHFAKDISDGIYGNIIDIGAGVCWSSAMISKMGNIESVTSVDLSEHRLLKIAPLVFKQLGGDYEKFRPIVADFLKSPLPNNHYNVAVFCQALYMFPDLNMVLKRVSELLVPGGLLIVACERITPEYPICSVKGIKRKAIHRLKGRADSTGNNFYTDCEYRNSIKKNGFTYKFQPLDYPVYPNNPYLNAGNYFGICCKK
ncbi:class I SAM-dependent methyltransferase [uncultured Methanolobus sp.]|uniref:class I SAM-dependent methyltransferase n=1 Tax=uncultured Methanolobus sp. TaxID=218300 RepID=UPI0029C841F0|nr:class I SAM-dependent methyltransferase [uncultured Methanolobus sp.]